MFAAWTPVQNLVAAARGKAPCNRCLQRRRDADWTIVSARSWYLSPARDLRRNNPASSSSSLRARTEGASGSAPGGGRHKCGGREHPAAHVELDSAWQLDDGFRMVAVLEQRIFDGLRAADEQAAEQPVLFLGDPLAAAVTTDEDDGGGGTARWRFDELHVGIPSYDGAAAFRAGLRPRVEVWLALRLSGGVLPAEGCLTHPANILRTGYEFDGGGAAMS